MKNKFTGWKDVFVFTLTQALKSRAYQVSLMVLLILALVSMPLISLITSRGQEDENAPSPIQKVYVDNESDFSDIEFTEILADHRMSHIQFETMQEDYDVVSERIEEEENDSVILSITDGEGAYTLHFVKASKGPVSDNSIQLLGDMVAQQFEKLKLDSLNMTEEQIAMIYAGVNSWVSVTDDSGAAIVKEDTSITFSEYWVIYGILFVVLMISMMASTQIATSIVTEKSTRVIEYLLTSVKPLALMVGKTLAMLTATIIQMGSMFIALFISNSLSGQFSSTGDQSVIGKYVPGNLFENLNTANIILCILVFLPWIDILCYLIRLGRSNGESIGRNE